MKTRLEEIYTDAKYNLAAKDCLYYLDGFLGLFWRDPLHEVYHLLNYRVWRD